jgi:hypothetical protein
MKSQAISLNQTRKTAIDPTVRTKVAIATDESKAMPHDSIATSQYLFLTDHLQSWLLLDKTLPLNPTIKLAEKMDYWIFSAM